MIPNNQPDTATSTWRKSTYSGAGNQCVEVGQSGPTLLIRDSKNPAIPSIQMPRAAWTAFLSEISS